MAEAPERLWLWPAEPEDGVSHRRTWVYVDAILALANLINREPEVKND